MALETRREEHIGAIPTWYHGWIHLGLINALGVSFPLWDWMVGSTLTDEDPRRAPGA